MSAGHRVREGSGLVTLSFALWALAGSCSLRSEEALGGVRVALASVPADVQCIRLSVDGSRLVQRNFDVTPESTPIVHLGGLPVGAVVISGAAFAESCGGAAAGTVPTWIADPVHAILEARAVAEVSLVMHRNGRAAVSVDFQDDVVDAGPDGADGGISDGVSPANDGGAGDGGNDQTVGPGTFIDIGSLGVGITQAWDINNLGQIVGISGGHPFLWEGGSMRDLGVALFSPSAINDHGQVAGEVQGSLGAIWENGVVSLLGTPSGWADGVVAINASGQILLRSWDPQPGSPAHLVVWYDGNRHDVASLYGGAMYVDGKFAFNDLGQVVGYMEAQGELRAFFWSAGTTRDLGTLGGPGGGARAINNAGQIVGVADIAPGDRHAFLWQSGTMQDLTVQSAGRCTRPVDISDAGDVLCEGFTGGGASTAFVWNAGSLEEIKGPEGVNLVPNLINIRRQIVGELAGEGAAHYFIWQGGTLVDIGVPPTPVWGEPVDFNDRGELLLHGISDDHAYVFTWR